MASKNGPHTVSIVAATAAIAAVPVIAGISYAERPIASPDSNLSDGFIDARGFGLTIDDTGDNGTALQAAIAAAQQGGGSRIALPAGVIRIATGVSISSSGVSLVGAGAKSTFIDCRTINSSCLQLSPPGGADGAQIYGTRLKGFTIQGYSQSSGYSLDLTGAATTLLDDIFLDHCANCLYATHFNSITVRSSQFIASGSPNCAVVKLDNDLQSRSDVITFIDTVITSNWSGCDGLVWDGPVYTVRWFGGYIGQVRTGLHIQNSRAQRSAYPQFGFFTDLEIDGASANSVVIDGGSDFRFVNGEISNTSGAIGQGNADGDAFVCNPDISASVTHGVVLVGGRIGNTRQRAALVNCVLVDVAAVRFQDGSKAGSGAYPMVEFGDSAADVSVAGGRMGADQWPGGGNGVRTSYGAIADRGAKRITLSGVNFGGNIKGSYLDKSAGQLIVTRGWSNTGTALRP